MTLAPFTSRRSCWSVRSCCSSLLFVVPVVIPIWASSAHLSHAFLDSFAKAVRLFIDMSWYSFIHLCDNVSGSMRSAFGLSCSTAQCQDNSLCDELFIACTQDIHITYSRSLENPLISVNELSDRWHMSVYGHHINMCGCWIVLLCRYELVTQCFFFFLMDFCTAASQLRFCFEAVFVHMHGDILIYTASRAVDTSTQECTLNTTCRVTDNAFTMHAIKWYSRACVWIVFIDRHPNFG